MDFCVFIAAKLPIRVTLPKITNSIVEFAFENRFHRSICVQVAKDIGICYDRLCYDLSFLSFCITNTFVYGFILSSQLILFDKYAVSEIK